MTNKMKLSSHRLDQPITSALRAQVRHFAIVALIFAVTGEYAIAEDSATQHSPTAHAYKLAAPASTTWEFGLKIKSSGNAAGIVATVPIPMDWPEQVITNTTQQLTDNIQRVRITNPTQASRQMEIQIDVLNAGETASAICRFDIQKWMIMKPSDTEQLKIAAPVPKDAKIFLKPSPQIESTHPRIRKIANELKDESLNGWEQVEKIYRWVRETVQYQFDPEIHTCLDALDRQLGDCEELSSLFIAICRAQGIPARAVWIPGHTYPEFYLVDSAGRGDWFPCQAAGEYQFGAMTELRPVLQKGDRFRLPGQSGYVRYVQPTLIAQNASGELSIEWIANEIPTSDQSQP